MSEFLSSEDRIERLESQVAELTNIQNSFVKIHSGHAAQYVGIISMIVMLKNENVATMRYLVKSNSLIDEKSKKEFLGSVARMESACEMLEATIAKLKASSDDPSETPPS
jgi:hypothetical protein